MCMPAQRQHAGRRAAVLGGPAPGRITITFWASGQPNEGEPLPQVRATRPTKPPIQHQKRRPIPGHNHIMQARMSTSPGP